MKTASPFHTRPGPSEYAPYYQRYIDQVPEGDVLELLTRQIDETLSLLRSVTEEQGAQAYAAGKWTVKEVVGHMADTERVFAYRAMCFARGEQQSLPGFDQDEYARHAHAGRRTMEDLTREFRTLRAANLALFASFDEVQCSRRGIANGKALSVRAILHIVAGHERHHVRILRDKYRLA